MVPARSRQADRHLRCHRRPATSGGEITPSIEVARKLADAFGVTVDSLVSERELPEILKDKEMLERWKALAEVPDPDRDRILFVIDGLIRDAKARQAYQASA
jgi:transcriptional regulator with XRE-family HTH domain